MHQFKGRRRDQKTKRGHYTGSCREEHASDPQRLGETIGVQWTGTTEGDKRIGSRIFTLFQTVNLGSTRHVMSDNVVDSGSGADQLHTERYRHLRFDRVRCALHIELHFAAEEKSRIEVAEHKIGIGDGWCRTAARITSGTRLAARTVGSDFE